MALRYRPMQPRDTRECAAIVAAHPVIGPRYGRAIQNLQPAWLRLLDSEAMRTDVYEEVNGSHARICGFGIGLFVSDAFVRELKTTPLFWFGPELARRVVTGNSPALSDKEVREKNSGAGLNLIVWEAVLYSEFEKRTDLYHTMIEAYLQLYRGFFLNEMITSQVESVPRLRWAIDAGGLFWDPASARYVVAPPISPEKFICKPHLIGITRELEFARLGSWIGTLFDYQPPQFGFSRSEQSLLRVALAAEGGTDQELAQTLHLSLPTIKKLWLSIYDRVSVQRPETIRDAAPAETTERGKEKRRRLLAYLREHPEELRPISSKYLAHQFPFPKRGHHAHP